jgi:transcriptional antiterminator NusG
VPGETPGSVEKETETTPPTAEETVEQPAETPPEEETAPVQPAETEEIKEEEKDKEEDKEKEEDKVSEEESKEEAAAEAVSVAEAPAETIASAEKPVEPVDESERRWFVIQTFSGQEDKVKANIEREVAQMNMGHKIFRVLVPEEETLEIKGTKRIEKVRKMFPGYVFVEMVLDDEAWYTIRQTPGVARFIGSGTKPQPVLDREMQRVLKQIGVKEEKLEVAFELGETVRVISGPFRGYTGSVNEVNADKGKLKILISIFGRDTPVEVNFEHAEKIS